MFRLTAVVALFVWLLGQTLCLQHCAKLTFAKGAHGCCAKRSNSESKAPAEEGKMLCGSLKLAKVETKTALPEVAILPAPSFLLITFCVRFQETFDLGMPAVLRALPRADFVFLPEVSLGAALRTTAPPALA